MDTSKIKFCDVRLWNPGPDHPASDGSVITKEVWDEYLRSDQYKENLKNRDTLGMLTHLGRSSKNIPTGMAPEAHKSIGRDDQMLLIETHRAPVWLLREIYYGNDGWYHARMEVLSEEMADQDMKNNILRLKSLLAQGIRIGVSAVIVAYWDSPGGFSKSTTNDVCKKIINVRSVDCTVNMSMPGARVMDVMDEFGNSLFEEKDFSQKEQECFREGVAVMKTFSADSAIVGDLPRTSKVGLSFTKLKAKAFSCMSEVTIEGIGTVGEKTFSVGTVKERLRFAKMTPRITFRRLMLDYKQAVRAAGGVEKMDQEDVEILKSLFAGDILTLIKRIHPDIMKGKQINTLLGAGTISKNARQAAQNLQLPYKMAMQQMGRQGFVTKDRYQKIQDAYTEFVKSLSDEVFGQLPAKDLSPVDMGVDNEGEE